MKVYVIWDRKNNGYYSAKMCRNTMDINIVNFETKKEASMFIARFLGIGTQYVVKSIKVAVSND